MASETDIAMFVHNDVTHDSRVCKEAASLAAQGWRVVVVGISLSGNEDVLLKETISNFTIIRVKPRLFYHALPGTLGKLIRLVLALPKVTSHLRQINAHIYHAHDFVGLLVMAIAGIKQKPVIYDSKELFFDRFPKGLFKYPLKYVIWSMRPLEGYLARRTTAAIVVNDTIADIMAAKLRIPRPIIIRNAVDIRKLAAPVPIQRLSTQLVLAHTGNLVLGRHLSELVASIPYLPDNTTVLLIGDGILKQTLIAQAEALSVSNRFQIMSPVPPDAVSSTLAQADVAMILITSAQLNYHFSLPNKFFEAVAAGIPIVSSEIPEVARLIKEYDIGEFCDPTDPSSIANAVATVLQNENYTRFSQNALRAREELNWEHEENKLVDLYKKLFATIKLEEPKNSS